MNVRRPALRWASCWLAINPMRGFSSRSAFAHASDPASKPVFMSTDWTMPSTVGSLDCVRGRFHTLLRIDRARSRPANVLAKVDITDDRERLPDGIPVEVELIGIGP